MALVSLDGKTRILDIKTNRNSKNMNDLAELAINVKALDKALEGSEVKYMLGPDDTQQFELDASIVRHCKGW